MINKAAINVQEVSKFYHLYDSPQERLKHALLGPFGKKYGREFKALSEVSMRIEQGESVGIIGRNGAGKSTLLQLIVGTLQPTSGFVEVQGRISALLELGAGFNGEFTGRQNVYLTAMLLGLSEKEIDTRFEEIVAFADIGDYMDQPLKTYSSGMMVRLAFAVQTAADPDILIVDEALSVGDIFFQQKCMRLLKKLRDAGVTLLFVSHDMAVVRDLCERTAYLKKGNLIFYGDTNLAIKKYFSEVHVGPERYAEPSKEVYTAKVNQNSVESFKESAIWVNEALNPVAGQKASLVALDVVDADTMTTMDAPIGGDLFIRILYQNFTAEPVHASVVLKNRYDQIINSSGSYTNAVEPPNLDIGSFCIFEIQLKCMIEAGRYTFSARLGQPVEMQNWGTGIDATPWLGPLTIKWDYSHNKAPFHGMFHIPTKCKFISVT